MEVLGFIFGIFGFLAYFEISSLKRRIKDIERELSNLKGSSFYNSRLSFVNLAESYKEKTVNISLKEEYQDIDFIRYGNVKNGTIRILDVDENWILVQIKHLKIEKTKLIRLEAIESISLVNENKH